MAEDNEPRDRQRADGGLARVWSAPARAVSRILSVGEAPITRTAPEPGPDVWVVGCAVYVDGRRLPGRYPHTEVLEVARGEGGFVWLGLHEPTEAGFAEVASTFGLDELAVEQAVTAGHRPKIERFGDVTLFVLRTARYLEHPELTETAQVVETGEILIFVGNQFVITVRHGAPGALGTVRADLEQRPELLAQGPWVVAYAVCDLLVDSYLEVAALVEADVDALEEHVFGRNTHSRIAHIYQLKRELMEFKRAVSPLQRPMAALLEDKGLVPRDIRRYFRDVNDHLLRAVERVSSYDDLLHSVLQARLAQVTVDQNNDLRKIAAWAAIAATQTAIAGIYGMNFIYMPEARTRYGYPIVLLVMFGSALALYRLFRRSGWL